MLIYILQMLLISGKRIQISSIDLCAKVFISHRMQALSKRMINSTIITEFFLFCSTMLNVKRIYRDIIFANPISFISAPFSKKKKKYTSIFALIVACFTICATKIKLYLERSLVLIPFE